VRGVQIEFLDAPAGVLVTSETLLPTLGYIYDLRRRQYPNFEEMVYESEADKAWSEETVIPRHHILPGLLIDGG